MTLIIEKSGKIFGFLRFVVTLHPNTNTIKTPLILPMKELSDIDLVQGLIDHNEVCQQIFLDRFRGLVYQSIDLVCEEISVSAPKTDSIREDLFHALCDGLHSDDDSQLKDYLAQERELSLETWLVNVKLPIIMPEIIVVDGLLRHDKEITLMFVSATNELSLRGMLNINRLSEMVRDIDHGGKPMNPQKLICEIFSLLMLGGETKDGRADNGRNLRNHKNHHHDGTLKGLIESVLKALPRYTKYYRGKAGREKSLTEDYDLMQHPEVEVDREVLNEFIQNVFFIMSHTEAGKRDVELLDEHFMKGTKQKDMAVKYGVLPNTMNQMMKRARERFRDVCCQFFGITSYNHIIDYYGKD